MEAWIEQVREDTPGVAHVAHFNNAGAALAPRDVTDTLIAHVRREAEIGGYEAADAAGDRLEQVYGSVARLLNVHPGQVGIVENATRAWDMAVYGYPFQRGDRVLTARAEYASNVIALLQLQRRYGIEIVLIEDDEHGQISLEHLAEELAVGAAMVALTHGPTNGGLINPASAVGALCTAHDTFFVLDACQTAGQMPLDVAAIGCDVLTGTSRKYLRGPRGIGFLVASPRALQRIEPPFLDLHAATWGADDRYEIRGDARRFENWETNPAAKLGFGAAVDYALRLGVDTTWTRVQHLAEALRRGLHAIEGVEVRDKGLNRGGIVTFTVHGRSADDVRSALAAARINTTVSPPEYARYDQPHRALPSLVRASLHYYNTEAEIGRLLDVIDRSPGASD
jgi:cysteine desulfurase / selenocysteine lyase